MSFIPSRRASRGGLPLLVLAWGCAHAHAQTNTTLIAAVMWWRQCLAYRLDAPPVGTRPAFSMALVISIVALALLFPLFGLSLAVVLLLDRIVLRQAPGARRWLGLISTAT